MAKTQVELDNRLLEQIEDRSNSEESIEEFIAQNTGVLPESSEFLNKLPDELQEPAAELIALIVKRYGVADDVFSNSGKFEYYVDPDSDPILILQSENASVEVFYRPLRSELQKIGELTISDKGVESIIAYGSGRSRHFGHRKLIDHLQNYLDIKPVG